MQRENSASATEGLNSILNMAAQAETAPLGMPGSVYTSEGLLELELDTLFKQAWFCVGRADELPLAGDYFTTEVGKLPIIVIRRDSGEIGAMLNVCSHRMAQVATGSGNAKRFACPYHGWVYDRNGALVQATHMPANFDTARCGLKTIKLESWNGFLYVNADPKAAPLASKLEPLSSLIEPYHLDRMQTLHKGHEIWDANWKIIAENFLESYHIDMVHAKTLAPLVPHETLKMVPDGPGFAFHTFRWADPAMVDLDPSIGVENKSLTDDQRRTVYVGGVFPNHMFTVAYDQITWMRGQPLGVDKTLVEWGVAGNFNIPRGAKPDPDHPNLYYLKAMPAVNAEDKTVVEGIQRGARSGMVTPARLHPYERPLLLFARFLADKLQRKAS